MPPNILEGEEDVECYPMEIEGVEVDICCLPDDTCCVFD